MKLISNLKRNTSEEQQLNKNIFLGIFGTIISGVYNLLRNEIQYTNLWNSRGNCFYKGSLQMIYFKMKCIEITTYAKTPIRVFRLVLLLIICLRFPRSQSIADVIRKRYGDKALKNVRKFERLHC